MSKVSTIMQGNSTVTKYSLLIASALIWGSQFLFNKTVLTFMAPAGIAWLRATIGMLTLACILPITKEKQIKVTHSWNYWWMISLIGLFEATLPFFLLAWGQQRIDSAMAAILMATVALFALILVLLFVKNEKVTVEKVIGILVGFFAIIILLWPQLSSATTSIFDNLLGELAVLVAALSFAISLILIKRLNIKNQPIRTARNILFAATVQLGLLLLVMQTPILHQRLNMQGVASILFLGIFAAGIAYVLYITLINKAGATFAGFSNYLVPVVGVILGVVFLHEKLHMTTYISLAVLIAAMIISELNVFGP